MNNSKVVKFRVVLLVLGSVSLEGCSAGQPVRTIDWYIAHDAERKDAFYRCASSQKDLQSSRDCTNVLIAAELAYDGKKQISSEPKGEDAGDGEADQVTPLSGSSVVNEEDGASDESRKNGDR